MTRMIFYPIDLFKKFLNTDEILSDRITVKPFLFTLIVVNSGIVVYFMNFFTGKNKNQKIANQWFNSHINILESQFALGDL